MKTSEQYLTEWAMQEIWIDLGRGIHKYPMHEFSKICRALSTDGFESERYVLQKHSEYWAGRTFSEVWARFLNVLVHDCGIQEPKISDAIKKAFQPRNFMWVESLVEDAGKYLEMFVAYEFGVKCRLREPVHERTTIPDVSVSAICRNVLKGTPYSNEINMTLTFVPKVPANFITIDFNILPPDEVGV